MTDQKIYIKAATQISMQQPLSEAWLTAPERPDVPYQRSQDPNFRDWLNPLESRRMGKLMKRALVTAQKVMKETGADALKLEGGENTEEFNKAMKKVSEMLFGSQDYAVVATKKG